MSPPKHIKVANFTFPSIKDAAAHFGVNKGNAVRRLNSGWTPEQAFELKPRPKILAKNRVKIITSIGTFNSIREAAIQSGIRYEILRMVGAEGRTLMTNIFNNL